MPIFNPVYNTPVDRTGTKGSSSSSQEGSSDSMVSQVAGLDERVKSLERDKENKNKWIGWTITIVVLVVSILGFLFNHVFEMINSVRNNQLEVLTLQQTVKDSTEKISNLEIKQNNIFSCLEYSKYWQINSCFENE